MDAVESIKTLIALVVIAITTIASCILGVRMRRRIKKSLGIQVTNEMELTSLKTWIDVAKIEENNRGGKLH